jgi:alginate O-acetyltransferase complex protein AlgI
LYFNLWLVFLFSGLWHGASWSFVLWGAYHGTFLVLERIFLLKVYERIGKFARVAITFFIVLIGWVFFRIEDISQAFLFLQKMFAFDFSSVRAWDVEFIAYLILAILFSFFAYSKRGLGIQDKVFVAEYSLKRHFAMFFASVLLFILSVSSITSFGFNPFIYFRF